MQTGDTRVSVMHHTNHLHRPRHTGTGVAGEERQRRDEKGALMHHKTQAPTNHIWLGVVATKAYTVNPGKAVESKRVWTINQTLSWLPEKIFLRFRYSRMK